MKELFRVAVEGEIWLMADNETDARRSAKRINALGDEVDLYVYPMLPVNPSMVDSDTLDSIPHNADPGDARTVGDHLRALAAARTPPKTPLRGTQAVEEE